MFYKPFGRVCESRFGWILLFRLDLFRFFLDLTVFYKGFGRWSKSRVGWIFLIRLDLFRFSGFNCALEGFWAMVQIPIWIDLLDPAGLI